MKMKSPIDRVRDGTISASIFRNENDKGDTYYSVSISKSYKDKDSGDWKQTNSYSLGDLQKLQNIAETASYRINAHQRMQGPEQTPTQDVPQTAPTQNLETQRDAALSNALPDQQTAPEVTPQQTR